MEEYSQCIHWFDISGYKQTLQCMYALDIASKIFGLFKLSPYEKTPLHEGCSEDISFPTG